MPKTEAEVREVVGALFDQYDYNKNGVLELNASDSRGIDVSDVTLLATRLSFACVLGRVLSADT